MRADRRSPPTQHHRGIGPPRSPAAVATFAGLVDYACPVRVARDWDRSETLGAALASELGLDVSEAAERRAVAS